MAQKNWSIILCGYMQLRKRLAIDITDGCGLSNKARHELLSRKLQGNAVAIAT